VDETRAGKQGWGVVWILGAGLALRVGWLAYARPAPVSDFLHYKILAEDLVDRHCFGFPEATARRMPAYPLFLAAGMLVSRSDAWLSFLNICLALGICAEVWFLTRRLLQERAAWWACLVCALNPGFVFFSPVLASEHLFTVLMLGSMLLAWPESGRGIGRACLSGLLWGMAMLARGEGLFYLPIIAGLNLWPMVRGQTHPGGPRGWSFRQGVLACVAGGGVLLPWYLRNAVVMGPGVGLGTTGGLVFYCAHNPYTYGYAPSLKDQAELYEMKNETEAQRLAYQRAWAHLKAHPAALLRSTFWGTVWLYAPSVYGIEWSTRLTPDAPGGWDVKPLWGRRGFWYLSLAGYGVLLLGVLLSPLTWREWTRLNVFVIAGMILCNWLCYGVIFAGNPRYHYWSEIFFCVMAGAVAARLVKRGGQAAMVADRAGQDRRGREETA